MVAVTKTVEFYGGSAWVDITEDVISGSLRWTGGVRGAGPADRVAIPGQLRVDIDNSQNNSIATLGAYSPNHASKRAGWVLGAKIRVKLVSGGNTRYWMYRLKDVSPEMGQYRDRRVEVTAMDYMNEFSKRKVSGLPIQKNKCGSDLLDTLITSMPIQPENTQYGTCAFTFPYAFHDEQDENTACLTVLQKISQSDLSYIYVDGDATDGETLHYEPHTARLNNLTPVATFSDSMTALDVIHSDDDVWNYVKANTYPVEIDPEVSVLGTIREEFSLEPSESRTVVIPYVDDVTERRISGENIITPEAGTDYKMSSRGGNGGSDYNSYLTVAMTPGANALSATVTNTGTKKGYINTLQVRGYKVKVAEKIGSVALDQTSIDSYGEKSTTFNMPYQNNSAFGQAVANEIVRRYKNPGTNVSGVTFIANSSTALMGYALTLGIGSRVTLAETVTGINSDFYQNNYEYELERGDILNVTLGFERAFNTTRYFTVADATYGVIGGAYEIAPF